MSTAPRAIGKDGVGGGGGGRGPLVFSSLRPRRRSLPFGPERERDPARRCFPRAGKAHRGPRRSPLANSSREARFTAKNHAR